MVLRAAVVPNVPALTAYCSVSVSPPSAAIWSSRLWSVGIYTPSVTILVAPSLTIEVATGAFSSAAIASRVDCNP